METENEEPLWSGTPSQILNFGNYWLWGSVAIGIIVAARSLEFAPLYIGLFVPAMALTGKSFVITTTK